MSIHEITSVDVRDGFVAIRAKDLGKELIIPECDLWAILNRDGLCRVALNKGIPGIRIELGKPPSPAPDGRKFISKFHHPVACEEGMSVLNLDAVFGRQEQPR